MSINIPDQAKEYGFVIDGLGAHSGRTIMLKDIRRLFAACPPGSTKDEYERAIQDDNVLLKKTGAARRESFSRLKRLYGLDEGIDLFRILRKIWVQEFEAQPLLLMLYAVARDPILRATVDLVNQTEQGEVLNSKDFEVEVSDQFGSELKESTLASIGRNIASSWTQSGHFEGRSEKVRKLASGFPVTTVWALLLAYFCKQRGKLLFDSPWVGLLDLKKNELHLQAQIASKQGWLDYRKVANVTEIKFDHLLEDGK